MKQKGPVISWGLVVLIVAGCAQTAEQPAVVKVETDDERLSYSVGYQMAQNIEKGLKQTNNQLEFDALVEGLRAGVAGSSAMMTEEEMNGLVQAQTRGRREYSNVERDREAQEIKSRGVAYLEENREKEGVVVLPSGVQYRVIKPGDGRKPSADESVVAHYEGRFIDGKVFDSSHERNEPLTFSVTGVIKGWQEVLQLMPVGSKWEVAIPSDLAYGSRGRPGIPPNATLIFDIELIDIRPGG